MLEWFQRLLNWLRQLFWTQELEVTLVGLQGAGKTTFVNVLSSGSFREDMIPTVGFNMRRVQKGRVTLKVWDIGGQPRFRNMWERYCRNVNAIVYMVDGADPSKIAESKEQLHKLFEGQTHAGATLQNIPLLILGNKNDLDNCLSKEELMDQLQLEAIEGREVALYSISCKNQNNLDNTISWLIQRGKDQKQNSGH